jgi:D-glycero-alpha-D-manno-heptose-7-phosphate kinase
METSQRVCEETLAVEVDDYDGNERIAHDTTSTNPCHQYPLSRVLGVVQPLVGIDNAPTIYPRPVARRSVRWYPDGYLESTKQSSSTWNCAMIISRTPFRISFFGGGTDYPAWYREHPGAVLGTTIDKYCYITCRYLPPFFDHWSRVIYSRVENVRTLDEIQHPSVRECLRAMNIRHGVEIHHDADLPARTGLGSSSAFTVGLLHALHALQGRMCSKMELAMSAIHVEQNLIRENVGSQDQVLTAWGGLNRVDFQGDHQIRVTPIILSRERLQALQDHLMLVFTGFVRTASDIAEAQIQATPYRHRELGLLYDMVDEATRLLSEGTALEDFGKLLHEAWTLKRSLTDRISTSAIDDLYDSAREAGAIGGKLLGAGGGGFMLLFVRPDDQPAVRQRLRHLLHVPFAFESMGSQIIYYDPRSSWTPQADSTDVVGRVGLMRSQIPSTAGRPDDARAPGTPSEGQTG